MPNNFTLDKEKPKSSLSLNKKNGVLVSSENKQTAHAKTERASTSNKDSIFGESSKCKENKPAKRPLDVNYFTPVNEVKKLKLDNICPQNTVHQKDSIFIGKWPGFGAMLNGHETTESETNGVSLNKRAPIGSLYNLGNTCFLNSVLYTLRFAPRFLHNLHHLVCDLSSVDQKHGSIRIKSSSLGRGTSLLAASSPNSWSAKDLLSLTQNEVHENKSKIQVVTERLHETYSNMTSYENKCSGNGDSLPESCYATAFLSALRDVNSTFEGNRQQDAHELLVCVLDCIRETCRALRARHNRYTRNSESLSNVARSNSGKVNDAAGRGRAGLRKSWKRHRDPPPVALPEPGHDFITEDFEGVTVLRTTCVECETVTERKQAMFDICIPVMEGGGSGGGGDGSGADERDPFRVACFASEFLRDQNKYWCDCCLRYNEARRNVSYERLPRLLVLHLKRFSGGMEKITAYHPTPLELACFCESCVRNETCHRYSLWAIVVHLGRTMSGGHYVAYARNVESAEPPCERTISEQRQGIVKALLGAQKPARPCAAATCCAAPKCEWVHCDDEVIRPITRDRLEKILAEDRGLASPYLLFYSKNNDE